MGALVHPFLLVQGRFLIVYGAMLALYSGLNLREKTEVAFLFRARTEE